MLKKKLVNSLQKNRKLYISYRISKKIIISIKNNVVYKNNITKSMNNGKRIFYYGIPAHANLGDLAQGVCIRNWLKENYKDYSVIEIETNALVNTYFSLIPYLKKIVSNDDLFIFQSGYTTTDLGGFADEMHQSIIKAFPKNKMLMMPQTIFFKSEKRKMQCSEVYNLAENMLFLARDEISFQTAKNMFQSLDVKCFPDIVTTMIGKNIYSNERRGILFCCRDDGEKYYSNKEIFELEKKCEYNLCKVTKTDTTKNKNSYYIINHANEIVQKEIEYYSRFEAILTDRYHGTIFSLAANTPVVIIKTTDHKVTTGAKWFDGVYDDYVYLVENLDEAYTILSKLINKPLKYQLKPYFKETYYNQLPKIWEEVNNENL